MNGEFVLDTAVVRAFAADVRAKIAACEDDEPMSSWPSAGL
jgi:hypothetical protein